MTRQIDLNSDLGESFGPWSMGDDEAMLAVVSSANVACGGHAGDTETMYRTLRTAAANGVVVGAHPGYPDREGFGRRVIPMPNDEIGRMVAAQVGALTAIAALAGTEVHYVKAHGALANLAAGERDVAIAIADAVQRVDERLALLAISGTELEHAGRHVGLTVYSEIFADRGYLPSGELVPRSEPGAMIHDVGEASQRLLEFVETGQMPVVGAAPISLEAHSVCVHGDSPGAVEMARVVRADFESAGIEIRSFVPTSP